MRRTTIMLPPDLKSKAEHTARERGISFAELVRRALAETIQARRAYRAYSDCLFADSAVHDGEAPTDLSTAHDGYLYGRP
jgi:predicted transcriptional regulator